MRLRSWVRALFEVAGYGVRHLTTCSDWGSDRLDSEDRVHKITFDSPPAKAFSEKIEP